MHLSVSQHKCDSRAKATASDVSNKLAVVSQVQRRQAVNRYGIVVFNVPLDILKVISETVLRLKWPNQQYHSTEGRWLVNHVKGQSHQAQLTKK